MGIAGTIFVGLMGGLALLATSTPAAEPPAEIRGTWVTTTANDAIATPEKTAQTMRRLREIGLNTVYVECWKNGYTQYPSKVLERTIGVDRRPALMKQDPGDDASKSAGPGRDLLAETLREAHKNNLTYIAWFEYGFMAAHKDTDNHLRRMKKEWLSLDKNGSEVAPNGFVWMNPLHPETRKFLLDLVCEAVDKYDLDGIQLDDRIVWPYVTMGYDAYTKKIYAQEHGGK
ncbi:MAG: family 10 glycosylhydrolase, partial [Planctomycetota bacterium]|nr:family 10 glycosylhydrolase [Planctomycetota bacterium]